MKSGIAPYSSPYKSPYKQRLDNKEMEEGEEEEDTRALLERMKETVEGMKRRRSEIHDVRMSVALDFEPVGVEDGRDEQLDEEDMEVGSEAEDEDEDGGSDKENAVEAEAEVDEYENSSGEEATQEPEMQPSHTPIRPTSTAPTKTPHLDLKHIFSAAQQLPKTPSFTGVRELFSADGKVVPQTPKLDGMRDLFRERTIPVTPAFEGVGEMMSTPSGWRMNARLDEAGDEDEVEVEETAVADVVVKSTRRGRSTIPTKPPSSTLASSSKIPATTTRRKTPRINGVTAKTPVTEGRSNFADDEATPGEDRVDEDNSSKKPVVRKGRSRATPTPVESDAEEGAEKVKGKARLIRGSKKVVDDIPEVCIIVLRAYVELMYFVLGANRVAKGGYFT